MKLEAAVKDGTLLKMQTGLAADCPYYYGLNIEELFPEVLSQCIYDKIFFVTNSTIHQLHGERFTDMLGSANIRHQVITVPDGERCKSFEQLSSVCEMLIEMDISKSSILISFGGGVIGNLVGLVSALLFRGIRFIEIPTTSMGQTDSTLSNKQAINGKYGKNQYGVYHAPTFIWSDSAYSYTEPRNYTKGSLVEGIKNGFINDPEFLDFLEGALSSNAEYTADSFFRIMLKVIESKLDILKKDPTEMHYGVALEYGHTFGHALEWLLPGISHGEAVAIGMCFAAELSYKSALCSDETRQMHYHYLKEKNGINIQIPGTITAGDILNTMRLDNKKTGNGIRFILLNAVGVINNTDGSYLTEIDPIFLEYFTENFLDMHRSAYSS